MYDSLILCKSLFYSYRTYASLTSSAIIVSFQILHYSELNLQIIMITVLVSSERIHRPLS